VAEAVRRQASRGVRVFNDRVLANGGTNAANLSWM
jgi:hypothetical protein